MDPAIPHAMRIGVNTLFLIPREVGGSETILRETLLEMVHNFPEFEWCFFTNRENDALLRSLFGSEKSVSFVRLEFFAQNRAVRIFREQFELPIRAKEAKIDVLWSPGYTAPLRVSCPQVVSILDVQYKSFPEDLSLFARWVTHALVAQASRRSERVVTLSHFSKREIVKYFRVPEDKIDVAYCAANPEFSHSFSKEESEKFLSTLMPDRKPYLLCVANSYPHKNLPCLVRAFEMLLEEIPHRLVLLGQPARGERALEEAMSKIPSDRILRLRHFYAPELVWLYQGADCFVLPSLYEGFGMPVLEAMAAGIPVVTTRSASIPEVAGEDAFYFDPKDPLDLAGSIRKAIELPPKERQMLAAKLQAHAKNFSWKQSAEVVIHSLRKALILHD